MTHSYQYEAVDATGTLLKGLINAESERDARQLLRMQQLVPIKINPIRHKRTLNLRSLKLKNKELTLFTRQLATLLNAGIPLEEALQGVIQQTQQKQVKTILTTLRSKVLEGYSLGQSMKDCHGVFPTLYEATVTAGEQSGQLDQVLEKLADYTEYQDTIRQKIKQAMIYPIMMICVSFAIIGFLLSVVVPKIIDVFKSNDQILPFSTRCLIHISHFFQHYGFLSIIFLLLLIVAGSFALKRPTVKKKFDRFLLSIPGLSSMIITGTLGRYMHTFSILFSSGVTILETMKGAMQLISNTPMKEAFAAALLKVKEGSSILNALKETSFVPPMALYLIASGEKSGQLAEMMDRCAKQADQDISRIIDTGMTLLEPAIILFMGSVVLFIVLATLVPIFSMEQLI